MSETTTITVSKETWRDLNKRRIDPSDTFDDVVARLLEETDDD